MTEKRGLERYQAALVGWISSTVQIEHLKGLASHSKAEQELLDTVFRRFAELTDSVDRLDLCLKFINAPMPRCRGIKTDDYLMYHITFYLQEVFVLEQRFRAYARSVLRLRKKRLGAAAKESENVEQGLASSARYYLLSHSRGANTCTPEHFGMRR